MILPILTIDNPILRKKAKRIWWINKEIKKLANDMLDTLKAANGLGLAAPQIGKSLRMVIVCDLKPSTYRQHSAVENSQPTEEKNYEIKPIILINPKIVQKSKEIIEMEEGCLSMPGYYALVKRPSWIICKAKTIDNKKIKIEARGILARSIQHEIDHLNGILFTDRMEKNSLRKVKKDKEF